MEQNFFTHWFAWLFEKIVNPTSVFAEAMEDNGYYGKAFLFIILMSLLASVSYYYVINHSRWNKNSIWAISGGSVTALSALFYTMYQYKQFDVLGYTDIAFLEYFWFWFYLFIAGLVIYGVVSWLIRQWSKNCSEIPSFLPRIINFKKNK